MKVAFFHDTYLYEGENQKIYSVSFGYDLWRRYIKNFGELVICARRADKKISDYSKYKISSGEHVTFQMNTAYRSPLQFFTERSKIIKPIQQLIEKVDGCIIRMPSIIGILAIQESIRQHKPYIIEVVTCCWDSLWNYGNIKGKLLAPIMYCINRHYIAKSSYVIYVTQEFLEGRYPTKGRYLGISDVELEKFDNSILKNREKKIQGTKQITLGLIGSLNVAYKGHEAAIKAIKELKRRGYYVRLKCLGGGSSKKWLKLCKRLGIEEQVEFCGTLPAGEQVLRWMDNLDIFIMPSLQEGLPRSMIEAMSRGCPVIGARIGGIPELIDEEYIIKPKDYKELSNKIVYLLENKEAALVQAKRNFEQSKKYTKDKLDQVRDNFFKSFRENISS